MSQPGALGLNLPVIGDSLGNALNSEVRVTRHELGMDSMMAGEEEEAQGETALAGLEKLGGSLLGKLFTNGDTELRFEDIASLTTKELEQRLEALDDNPDNVFYDEATGRFDVTIAKNISGTADVDVSVLGGSVTLAGEVTISADITLHVVFGVDERGFFIDGGAVTNELVINHLAIGSDLAAGGHFGFLDVEIGNFAVAFDPGIGVALDLTQPTSADASGLIRMANLLDLSPNMFDVTLLRDTASTADVTFAFDVAISSVFGQMDPQNFVFTWPDVTQPAVLTISGAGVDYIKSRIADLSQAIKDGVAQLQNVADLLQTNPALNTELPLVNKRLSEVIDGGAGVALANTRTATP